MRMSTRQMVLMWSVPVIALLLAAMASGGFHAWFFYSLAAVGVGALASALGPWAFRLLTPVAGGKNALVAGSAVGWLVLSGVLLLINLRTEHAITWAIYPFVGLATWPIVTWLFMAGEENRG